jgi:hypothetical protein
MIVAEMWAEIDELNDKIAMLRGSLFGCLEHADKPAVVRRITRLALGTPKNDEHEGCVNRDDVRLRKRVVGSSARPHPHSPRRKISMTSQGLESVALTLVAEGKGILAADETIPTLARRFDTLGIQSTEKSRRAYREMLFTSPGAAEFISGVIMYDETIRQKSSDGTPLAEALTAQGAPSPSPALPTKPSPRGLTVCGIASGSTTVWVRVSRSGGQSSTSRTLYRVPPA